MKIKYLLIFLLTIIGCNYQNSNNQSEKVISPDDEVLNNRQGKEAIENTRWERHIADGCVDYYEFIGKDSLILFYCEPGDKIFGNYSFEGDTIVIKTMKGEFDDEFTAGSSHRHKKRTYKMVFMQDSIGFTIDSPNKLFRVKNE